ncbi:hypothetical protein SAMN05192558_102181 [Actinokineospora alba]|uniref:DUF7919 domain-containing protein n=1 Tax=Actinokineospora alba TaxID=504798 RepID=A0A1H0HMU4_9PSEU|nr:hypothetical protein [Actinokineospora alba]TDP64826.1 hypothetical protein C8E96_0298 [Actinokineospora alba]SDH46863.1 hypothetical protein SAMN05421871_101122 [Actinokineospora alba]SDO20492.1 hypothetical protein SAMN05192558_102181 [Actinokineospora alba]
MTRFRDLTKYEYFDETVVSLVGEPHYVHYRHQPTDRVLNVGWLNFERFDQGDVPADFVARLDEYATDRVNQTRGSQSCPICGLDNPSLGSAEIHVQAPDGTIYAAPALVAHYVSAHRYRPPKAFIDAVLTGRNMADIVRDAQSLSN